MNAHTTPIPELSPKDIERFWAKVEILGLDDCWIWQGHLGRLGYGKFKIRNKLFGAHRISYFIANGPFPEDRPHTRHTCDNGSCVNPAHLLAGTQMENRNDIIERNRGNQPKGESHWSKRMPTNTVKGSRHGGSKLKEDDVLAIRSLYRAGGITQAQLGIKFDIARTIITRILNYKLWAHIP